MKKWCVALIVLACSVGIALVIGNIILGRVTTHAISYAPLLGRELGLAIENPVVEVAKISGLRSLSWLGASGRIKVRSANSISRPGAEYYLTIDFLGVTVLSLRRILIELDGLRLDPIPEDKNSFSIKDVRLPDEHVGGRIEFENLQLVVEVQSLFSPRKELRQVVDQLRSLLTDGATSLAMTVKGKLTYSLGETPRFAQLVTDTRDGLWVFLLDQSDIAQVIHYFDFPLEDPEIALISRYPFRAAELLSIREEVMRATTAMLEGDRSAPEQAFRQVYWSYLLARRFDAIFSERITDAHLHSQEFLTQEQVMHFSNARVGREWADSEDLSLEQLQKQVRTSEDVIRLPVVSESTGQS